MYLDGSANEAFESNGTGAWWVKHSWVVDGEGYTNCTLAPPRETYDDCFPVEGILLDGYRLVAPKRALAELDGG